MAAKPLSILCFIVGEDSTFPVDIASNKTVGNLKDEIKAKAQNSLAGIDAHQLKLYDVEIPEDGDMVAAVDQKLSEHPTALLGGTKLAKVFESDLKEDTIHIVVQLPGLPLAGKKHGRASEDDVDGGPTAKRLHASSLTRTGTVDVSHDKRRRLALLPQSLTVFKTEADPERPHDTAHLPMLGGFHDMTSLYNLIAVDKTRYIELLDKEAKYQYMFLRPRRWGKSTFLQTLMDYYDKGNQDRFDNIFGDLYIGKNPTAGRNSLLVLRFDFSEVSGMSSPEIMIKQFNRTINFELERFLRENQEFLGGPNLGLVDKSDGSNSLKAVLGLVKTQGEKLFVGVDEYDAPANTVIFDGAGDRYLFVAEFFKSQFFAIMKQAAFTVVHKYWITGVLPVFRDGISPLNATQIISGLPGYNGLCGLTDTEVQEIARSYLYPSYKELPLEGVVEQLKRWYNGYIFCKQRDGSSVDTLYNPQLVFSHLRGLANKEVRLAPLEEINAVHTSNILAAIPDTGNASFLESYLNIICHKIKMKVVPQFGADEVRQHGKDTSITWTLLYFFGVLTHTEDGQHLRVPNVTMINVITLRFSKFLNKQTQLLPKSKAAYDGLLKGKVEPLVDLLESFFGNESARAVKGCNEAALRTALAAFWSNYNCLTELSLLVDPNARRGDGRSAFLDLFLTSPSSVPCIELKNIQLEALWEGQHGDAEILNSDQPLEVLRTELRSENEDQLLKRRVFYGGKIKSIGDVKGEAFRQISNYLEVMKNGVATANRPGVHDQRVQQNKGECELAGYAVILVGGTRALGWRVKTDRINCTLDIKVEAQEDTLIS